MAEAGHNSKLTDDERAALYGYLCREERDQLAVIAGADAKRKENFKKAKEWGFSKEEITFREKARRAGEGSSIVKKHALHKTILIKLGFIHDDRGGDLLSDRVDKLQLHNRRGYDDGLCGEGGPGASGFAANSDEDRAYMDGWKEGQRVYLDNWKTAMEKAQAARTKEEAPVKESGSDPFAAAKEAAEPVAEAAE